MITTELSSWKDIEEEILRLQKEQPKDELWGKVASEPISKEFIDDLVKKKWRVLYRPYNKNSGVCSFQQKKIVISRTYEHFPYRRDVILFHELAHARHGELLSSNHEDREKRRQQEIIAEWLGRKARANPELLHHAVLSLGLQPQVYDQSSYRAFNDLVRQPALPLIDYHLLMD